MRFRGEAGGGWRSGRDRANSREKWAGEVSDGCLVGDGFGFLEQRRSLRLVRVRIGIWSSICVGHCPNRRREKMYTKEETHRSGERGLWGEVKWGV